MGRYGLISDTMQKTTVVLWNGTVLEASPANNSDLFWGIRGAGHNFGVVVESTFETWPDNGGLHYNVDMVFTDDSIDGVLDTVSDVIRAGLSPDVFLILGYVFDSKRMKVRDLGPRRPA